MPPPGLGWRSKIAKNSKSSLLKLTITNTSKTLQLNFNPNVHLDFIHSWFLFTVSWTVLLASLFFFSFFFLHKTGKEIKSFWLDWQSLWRVENSRYNLYLTATILRLFFPLSFSLCFFCFCLCFFSCFLIFFVLFFNFFLFPFFFGRFFYFFFCFYLFLFFYPLASRTVLSSVALKMFSSLRFKIIKKATLIVLSRSPLVPLHHLGCCRRIIWWAQTACEMLDDTAKNLAAQSCYLGMPGYTPIRQQSLCTGDYSTEGLSSVGVDAGYTGQIPLVWTPVKRNHKMNIFSFQSMSQSKKKYWAACSCDLTFEPLHGFFLTQRSS